MQLAGLPCTICYQSVAFENDATWCGACKSVFHRQCLAKQESNCPTCKIKYDPPERHYVYSEFCPECMRPNNPPEANCKSCHTRTRWDTKADYEDFVSEMRDAARLRSLRGIVELGGGFFCLIALIGVMAFLRPIFGAFWALLGFMTLT